MGPPKGGAGKKYEVDTFGWLENGILKMVFANIAFHDNAILPIFETEYTDCNTLLRRVYDRAHRDWARGKIFKPKVLRLLENTILQLVLENQFFIRQPYC